MSTDDATKRPEDHHDVTDDDVIAAMTTFGGSFVKALAEAARCADVNNLYRIKRTWPEYWKKYSADDIQRAMRVEIVED